VSLRQRLTVLVAVVALLSAALFSASLLYAVRATLGFWENPKIERGIELAATVPQDSLQAAEGRQAYTAYHHLKVVKGLVEQRVAVAGVLFGLLVFGLSLGLSLLVLARLTRPLGDLAAAIERAGTGDLTVKVRSPKRSEVTRVAEAFNAMTERLRLLQEDLRRSERLAAWRDVARVLAHEVRNPLTPIRLSAERLQAKAARGSADLAAAVEQGARTIVEETETLDRIVREFSEFARMPPAHRRPTDVNGLLAGIVAEYRLAYPGLAFELESDPGIGDWSLDPELMRRVFTNVIKNSVEALGPAGGTVRVRSEAAGGRLRLVFEDDGPGIPDAVRQRAFEPYFTTKTGGTGLGLAVCRNAVSEHGGTVRIETPQKGARIVVELPEEHADEDEAAGD